MILIPFRMEVDSIHRYTATPAILVRTFWEAVQVLLHVAYASEIEKGMSIP